MNVHDRSMQLSTKGKGAQMSRVAECTFGMAQYLVTHECEGQMPTAT